MPILSKSYRSLAIATGIGCLVALGGCANTYSATERTASGVGVTATIREGVVIGVQPVTKYVAASGQFSCTSAILGGIAGSNVGGGDDERAAGAVAGAVLGGVIGNEVGEAANTRPGYAYTIDFGNGQIQEIVQGVEPAIAVGTPVYVSFGEDAVRVTPKPY